MSILKEAERYLPEGEEEIQTIETSIIEMWASFENTKLAIIAQLEEVDPDRVDDFSRKYIDPLEDAINQLDNETEKEPFNIEKSEERDEEESEEEFEIESEE